MDVMGAHIPLWWGVVVLIAGAVSSLIGVLFALTEHDLKRLLAYHSIENIGIILLGLGSALIFASLHQNGLMLLSLAAALFHTLNHAVFKSLLFLSAGSVIQATHTRNIEAYGGLMKLLPATGLLFLIGSMAISALPPFNGFFSEWLTFQSLFSGIAMAGNWVVWVFVVAAASLAMTGGLALACFVKAVGTTFLARPRSDAARHARESGSLMKIGMTSLAALCIVIGLAAAPVTAALQNISKQATGVTTAQSVLDVATPSKLGVGDQAVISYYIPGSTKPLFQDYGPVAARSSVSGPVALLLLAMVPLGIWLGVKYGVYRRQKVTVGPTWDCGTDLNERMEITATGFSQSIIRVFKGFLMPSLHQSVERHEGENPYHIKARKVQMNVRDMYQAYLYRPLYALINFLARSVRYIHHGNLNAYVLYIFVTIIIVLMIGT
jgi:hydrogenase-4 component B